MKRSYSFILTILFLFSCISCAQVHSGHYAVPLDQPLNIKRTNIKHQEQTVLGLLISGKENKAFSSKYFAVIDFTFENLSQEWIRIKKIKINFENEKINKNIKFTSGNDLTIWHASTKKRNIIKDFNTEMVLGAITAFGAGLAAGSDQKNVKDFGNVLAVGGAASLSVYEFNKVLNSIEKSAIFPESHLFATDFVIPPGLFVKKWLLCNSKNHNETGYISHIFLEYEIEDGTVEKLKLDFRGSFDKEYTQKWQNDLWTANNHSLIN